MLLFALEKILQGFQKNSEGFIISQKKTFNENEKEKSRLSSFEKICLTFHELLCSSLLESR